jgi:hypothetical protein
MKCAGQSWSKARGLETFALWLIFGVAQALGTEELFKDFEAGRRFALLGGIFWRADTLLFSQRTAKVHEGQVFQLSDAFTRKLKLRTDLFEGEGGFAV